jgi:hypothetical protein
MVFYCWCCCCYCCYSYLPSPRRLLSLGIRVTFCGVQISTRRPSTSGTIAAIHADAATYWRTIAAIRIYTANTMKTWGRPRKMGLRLRHCGATLTVLLSVSTVMVNGRKPRRLRCARALQEVCLRQPSAATVGLEGRR